MKLGSITFLALIGALAHCVVETNGHGLMTSPKPRNLHALESGLLTSRYDATCLNNNIYETSFRSSSVCGQIQDGGPNGMNYDFYSSGSQATYQAGQVITVEIEITVYHFGHFEFSLCPAGPTGTPSQDCFRQNKLKIVADNKYGAPVDPRYPERAMIPPANFGDEYSYQVALPSNLAPGNYVLKWMYVSGNSCTAVGYSGYNFPSSWGPMYTCGLGTCGVYDLATPLSAPEIFINCAEVTIVGNSQAEAPRDDIPQLAKQVPSPSTGRTTGTLSKPPPAVPPRPPTPQPVVPTVAPTEATIAAVIPTKACPPLTSSPTKAPSTSPGGGSTPVQETILVTDMIPANFTTAAPIASPIARTTSTPTSSPIAKTTSTPTPSPIAKTTSTPTLLPFAPIARTTPPPTANPIAKTTSTPTLLPFVPIDMEEDEETTAPTQGPVPPPVSTVSSEQTTPISPPPVPTVSSPSSFCGGGKVGNGICKNGKCSSKHGYCACTAAHCINGQTCPGGLTPKTKFCGDGHRGNGICLDGSCCSKDGFCGISPEHCINGQTTTSGRGGSSAGPSKDGFCGDGQIGNGICANGRCCSEFGYCGCTTKHCQKPGQTCAGGIAPKSEFCGDGYVGNGICMDGSCCSEYGYCDCSTEKHCVNGQTCKAAPSSAMILSGLPSMKAIQEVPVVDVATTTTTEEDTPCDCGTSEGLIAANGCDGYALCVDALDYGYQPCGPGYKFSQRHGYCDLAQNVECTKSCTTAV